MWSIGFNIVVDTGVRVGIFMCNSIVSSIVHKKPCAAIFLANKNNRRGPWAIRLFNQGLLPHFSDGSLCFLFFFGQGKSSWLLSNMCSVTNVEVKTEWQAQCPCGLPMAGKID